MKMLMTLLVLLSLAGCMTKETALTDQDKAAIQTELVDAVKGILKTLEASDYQSIMKGFSNQPGFLYTIETNNMTYADLDGLAKGAFEGIDHQEVVEIVFEQSTVLSRDLGTYALNFKSKTVFKSGVVHIYDNHLITWVLQKINGEWKIILGHESMSALQADSSAVKK